MTKHQVRALDEKMRLLEGGSASQIDAVDLAEEARLVYHTSFMTSEEGMEYLRMTRDLETGKDEPHSEGEITVVDRIKQLDDILRKRAEQGSSSVWETYRSHYIQLARYKKLQRDWTDAQWSLFRGGGWPERRRYDESDEWLRSFRHKIFQINFRFDCESDIRHKLASGKALYVQDRNYLSEHPEFMKDESDEQAHERNVAELIAAHLEA